MHRSVEAEFIGRTYDDFLLRPQLGVVPSRRDVSLRTSFSRRISLELPVVSANMDSVTGPRMAQALALEGGIGFIHRAMPIAAQAESVARVKRTYGYVVEQPLSLSRGTTVREAREFIAQHDITGILIEERRGSGILVGLLSNRDLPWLEGFEDQGVEEFMTPIERLVTGPPDITIEEAERRMFARRIEKLPLVDGERRIRGLITKRDIILTRRRPYSSKDGKGRLLVGAAIGAQGDFLERAAELLRGGADVILIVTGTRRLCVEPWRRSVPSWAMWPSSAETWGPPRAPCSFATSARMRSRWASAPGEAVARDSRPEPVSRSSRRFARPGARWATRCRSSRTEVSATTRISSWP